MYEEVKQAVHTARQYVEEVFGSEQIENVGLEEVFPNEESGGWLITIGFSRRWDPAPEDWSNSIRMKRRPRSYKVVQIDSDGQATSVQDHSGITQTS